MWNTKCGWVVDLGDKTIEVNVPETPLSEYSNIIKNKTLMSDNAVEYKTKEPLQNSSYMPEYKSYGDGIEKFMPVTKWQERNLKEPHNIEAKLSGGIHEQVGSNAKVPYSTRKKTYEIEYAKDGVLIKGFIDGKLVDSGIVKFNRKDKLDVN